MPTSMLNWHMSLSCCRQVGFELNCNRYGRVLRIVVVVHMSCVRPTVFARSHDNAGTAELRNVLSEIETEIVAEICHFPNVTNLTARCLGLSLSVAVRQKTR